jgi:hypothetical protein
MIETLMLAHAASTLCMTGLIWFVQIVHYPLFQLVGERTFRSYAAQHVRRTTWVVAPLMLVEAGTASALVWTLATTLSWIGLLLLAVIWASTALLQVPGHGRLARGFEPPTAERLVRTNWIRTAAWTGRGAIALLLLDGS